MMMPYFLLKVISKSLIRAARSVPISIVKSILRKTEAGVPTGGGDQGQDFDQRGCLLQPVQWSKSGCTLAHVCVFCIMFILFILFILFFKF